MNLARESWPSGVKHHFTKNTYDGDIHLKTLSEIQAFEVRALLFNVWNEFTGTRSTTGIKVLRPNREFTLDPRWYGFSWRLSKHYTSISYIARVRYTDGRIIHADIEPVLRTARRFSEDITVEDLVPAPDSIPDLGEQRKAE